MSGALSDQILLLLEGLKANIDELTKTTASQAKAAAASIDDIAAHTLAVQGIIVAQLKKYPVSSDDVAAWIREQTWVVDKSGEGAQKAIDLADYLINGNQS